MEFCLSFLSPPHKVYEYYEKGDLASQREWWNIGMATFGQINACGETLALPPQAVKKITQRAQIPFIIYNSLFSVILSFFLL